MYLFGIILRAIKNNIQYLFFIPSLTLENECCYLYPCGSANVCKSFNNIIVQKIIIVTKIYRGGCC